MLLTTTDTVEGHRLVRYVGIVGGQSVLGVWTGGAAGKDGLHKAIQQAMDEMRASAVAAGANAVVGVRIDHETQPNSRTVLAYGTAVYLVPLDEGGEDQLR